MKLFKSPDFYILLFIIFLSWFSLKPFFTPEFFSVHDDTQIARVFVMSEALKEGQFPVRVVDFLGYSLGYTIFNFYGPFAYYLGAFFVLLGFDGVIATKIMIGLAIPLAGIFMYLLGKEFWGRAGGLVAGVFYIYAPYHAVNAYVRGAIGELWAYTFIPLTFFGFYKLFDKLLNKEKKDVWKYITISSLGYAGIIISHNLTALMVTPFLLLMLFIFSYILFKKKIFAIWNLRLAFVFGLGLAAFYWLPAIWEMRYADVGSVLGGGSDFRDHFICWSQFWYSPWGFGGSVPGCVDGLSLQLGKIHILLSIFTFLSLPILYIKEKRLFSILLCTLLSIFITLFLMSPQSLFIWELLPPMEYLQFPWRFLVMASFLMSFSIGSLVYLLQNYLKVTVKKTDLVWLIAIIIVILTIGFYSKYFVPQKFLDDSSLQTRPGYLLWETSKISDEYLPKSIKTPGSREEVLDKKIVLQKGNAEIEIISQKASLLQAQIVSTNGATLQIQTAYFPAWKLFINDRESSYDVENGLIIVTLPKGNYDLRLEFHQTMVEKIGNAISVISVLALILGIIKTRKKQVT